MIPAMRAAYLSTVASGAMMAGLGAPVTDVNPHRYWRLYITDTDAPTDTTARIAALEFRPNPGVQALATGGTSSASSSVTHNNAFDPGYTGVWASNAGSARPSWVAYDYGVGVSINVQEVQILCDQNRVGKPTAIQVQFSDDGIVWTTKWSATLIWNGTQIDGLEYQTSTVPFSQGGAAFGVFHASHHVVLGNALNVVSIGGHRFHVIVRT